MPVALGSVLAANALISLEQAKAHLSILRPTDVDDLGVEDQQLVEAINWVSAWVEQNVRPMVLKTETVRLAAPRHPHVLRLRRIPIDTTFEVTVHVAGVEQIVWLDETDGERLAADVLTYTTVPAWTWGPDALWRLSGWGGATGWGGGWWGHPSRCGCGCGGGGGHVSGDPQPIVVTYTGGWDCQPEDGTPNRLPGDVQFAVKEAVRSWFRTQQQGLTEIVSIAQPGGGATFETPRWFPYAAREILSKYRPEELVGF